MLERFVERIPALVVIAVVIFLIQWFITNPLAQKLLPTKLDDAFSRRWGYQILHRLIFAAALITIMIVISVATGRHF